MATRVGAYSPETAALVLRVIAELQAAGYIKKSGAKENPKQIETLTLIAKSPQSGIPPRSGTIPGSASCPVYRIDKNGELVNVLDNQGQALVVPVYHIGSSSVGPNRYIQAKRIFGSWVADFEDCP